MNQNSPVFYGNDRQPQPLGNDGFFSPQEYGDEEQAEEYYTQEDYGAEGYVEDGGVYDAGNDGMSDQGMNGDELSEEEYYSVYNEELDGTHRFHVAMNVLDTASVLAGVVVILVLIALIASLFSWLRTDITHSFVLLQSGIQ